MTEYDSEFLAELFDTFSNKKRLDAFLYISKHDRISIKSELTDYIGDSAPTLQRHINVLKNEGYIEKEANKYQLTEKGTKFADIIESKIFEEIKTIDEENKKKEAIKMIEDYEKTFGTEEAISMLESAVKNRKRYKKAE
ncbi:MAG: winged helix-turn-helix domain-containing protein [Nanoarchaeota archaeon]|nr:winged helix-turn-helix domain-containing protein [Nanoarchaeota archaeon]